MRVELAYGPAVVVASTRTVVEIELVIARDYTPMNFHFQGHRDTWGEMIVAAVLDVAIRHDPVSRQTQWEYPYAVANFDIRSHLCLYLVDLRGLCLCLCLYLCLYFSYSEAQPQAQCSRPHKGRRMG